MPRLVTCARLFPELLEILKVNFPNVVSLKLALKGWAYGRFAGERNERTIMLDPLDDLARHYGEQLETLEFAIGQPFYDKIRNTFGYGEISEMVDEKTHDRRYYRSVGEAGYWVILGAVAFTADGRAVDSWQDNGLLNAFTASRLGCRQAT